MDISATVLAVRSYFLDLQSEICETLAAADGETTFSKEPIEAPNGGLAQPRVLTEGKHIEKAAVQFTHSIGDSLPPAATERNPHLAGSPFQATAISLIVHPLNPHVPTTHMNLRFFIVEADEPVWYFGGGYDLTPYYGFEEDCRHWHQTARQACDGFGEGYYEKFRDWCDEYFYLKHRNEPRGVGGLFFDDFNQLPFEESFAFVQSLANSYMKAYRPIVEKRKDSDYGAREKSFQEYRRGRYVEFNLVYDRGTVFGLQSGVGRIESILMSLPPAVQWVYDWQPEPGSAEEKLYTDFLIQREWA